MGTWLFLGKPMDDKNSTTLLIKKKKKTGKKLHSEKKSLNIVVQDVYPSHFSDYKTQSFSARSMLL